jgi:hypothetical protein
VAWDLGRKGFALDGARGGGEYSQDMIPLYLLTVNRHYKVLGSKLVRGGRRKRNPRLTLKLQERGTQSLVRV